jgi:hypothetical protein
MYLVLNCLRGQSERADVFDRVCYDELAYPANTLM